MFRRWLLFALLVSPLVFAYQDREFSWTPPTQNEDGSPLDPADLEEFRIYCNGGVIGVTTGDQISWQSPDGTFPPGTYTCHATAVANGGLESGPSNQLNFTVTASQPMPPSSLVAQ